MCYNGGVLYLQGGVKMKSFVKWTVLILAAGLTMGTVRAFLNKSAIDETTGDVIGFFVFFIMYAGYAFITSLQRKKKTDNSETDMEDERNVIISQKSGYTAWKMNFFALILMTVIMFVLQYWLPALLVMFLLLANGVSFFLAVRHYDKNM
jgi:uncharacterized membrane protein